MNIKYLLLGTMAVLATSVAIAQGQKTLASTMDVFVFPKEGQDAADQSKAEAECYSWATQNTGNDPFELTKKGEQQQRQAEQQKQQAQQAGQGSGARGALRGAAVGALIGEIANDDAGDGAAWGAAAGLAKGRRQGRAAQQSATQRAERQADQAKQSTAVQIENFKKAFSVCLEAKDFLVKY